MKKLSNQIHLITYPDSLGSNLKDLKYFLDKYFKNEIKGVHILPFYPSSADRGFSPLTHMEVDSAFGDWPDIKDIAQDYELTCDIMVNHISSVSKYFQDYLYNGDESKYADYFITSNKFSRRMSDKQRKTWNKKLLSLLESFMSFYRRYDFILHKDGVNRFALKKIYRPRVGSPFVEFKFKNGNVKEIWCTFSPDQIDLDIHNKGVRKMFKNTIDKLSKHGVKMIRLDAVGYVAKKRGTTNFFIKDTYDFVKWIADVIHDHKIETLPEVHHSYLTQMELAKAPGVDYVYDFALPLLCIYALESGNSLPLKNWIKYRPTNAVTTLDTHDGIGVVDVKGIMSQKEIDYTVELIHMRGGDMAKRALGTKSEETEIYQMNSTYYSALGENDDAYLAARVIQFFLPGIPQIYYTGLLAGTNDVKLFCETGIGRNLNRHGYSEEEIKKSLEKKVVKRLFKLIDFRNNYPAFQGEFSMKKSGDEKIILNWERKDLFCEAKINLKTKKTRIKYLDQKTREIKTYQP